MERDVDFESDTILISSFKNTTDFDLRCFKNASDSAGLVQDIDKKFHTYELE